MFDPRDPVDRAGDAQDSTLMDALRRQERARAAAAHLPACGFCYGCNGELGGGLRFCSGDCATGWADQHSAKLAEGTR